MPGMELAWSRANGRRERGGLAMALTIDDLGSLALELGGDGKLEADDYQRVVPLAEGPAGAGIRAARLAATPGRSLSAVDAHLAALCLEVRIART